MSAVLQCRPHCCVTLSTSTRLTLISLRRSIVTSKQALVGQLVRLRSVAVCRRPSDPWFDDRCHEEKRQTRRLERKFRNAKSDDDQVANRALWVDQLWKYRRTLNCRLVSSFHRTYSVTRQMLSPTFIRQHSTNLSLSTTAILAFPRMDLRLEKL